ncbi:MAG: aconitate hydratase, partial [Spirochaetales bacterium]|nr:aconitate hydratase [Spirochaetales bacterium]
MRGTITEGIIREHLAEGEPAPGKEIGLRVDQALTQDATGTMVYLEFESLKLARVQVELAVSYIDHNIIQTDHRNADDHRFLQTSASKFGVLLSQAGNGVSHHVHRQRFGEPGKTLLGSDSHTTTGGCLGMLAMGAGGVEVALAMAGRPYYLVTPEVWGFRLTGELPPYVSGKDLILEILRRYSVKAGIGKVMEFFGPGVAALGMAARATVANMAVDGGFTAAVFPSDEETRRYLAMNGREAAWRPLSTAEDAQFSQVTEVDLGALEPLVACPSNPDNVRPARELGDVEVEQVIIGSSCNGSYYDFMVAAEIVAGKMKHPTVSFEINPGSRQTLESVLTMGGLQKLIEAGARVHQPGCLGCIGMGQAPGTGTNSLRTFPRNFKGRSGTRDDAVYLCSPETAAASALSGRITDPRTLGGHPQIRYPESFHFNPAWLVPPAEDPETVEIIRGPNIAPFPHFEELPRELDGEVLLKVGDNISTDIIMPAGSRVLPYRSNIPAISDFVFDVLDPDFPKRARERGGGFVVGGENYGQGSSREHAALAPRYLGVTAKIAKSFARIHKANLVNFGILPLVFAKPQDYEALAQGDRLRIPDLRKQIEADAEEIPVFAGSRKILTLLQISPRQRRMLLAGGVLNL